MAWVTSRIPVTETSLVRVGTRRMALAMMISLFAVSCLPKANRWVSSNGITAANPERLPRTQSTSSIRLTRQCQGLDRLQRSRAAELRQARR
eukprot:m.229067 g.229067  ORF g.229067 m.229067 type:complete len:92 (-) comp25993_c1_seq5:925-1200(-)